VDAPTLTLWGTEFPRHHGDADSEFETLCTGSGTIDLSAFALVRCKGPDAVSFLQGMISQDVRRLGVGKSAPAWILDVSGKIVEPLQLYRQADDEVLMLAFPGRGPLVRDHLDRYLIMEDAQLSLVPDLCCLSRQGAGATRQPTDAHAFENDRCGHGGWDLIVPRAQIAQIAWEAPIGFAALDRARILAFLPWLDREISRGTNPLIYGSTGISHTKGCFIGQETVAKTRDRGRPPKRMVQVTLAGAEAPQAGEPLLLDGKQVGTLTSVAQTGTGATAIAIVSFAAAASDVLGDGADRSWRVVRRASYKAS